MSKKKLEVCLVTEEKKTKLKKTIFFVETNQHFSSFLFLGVMSQEELLPLENKNALPRSMFVKGYHFNRWG